MKFGFLAIIFTSFFTLQAFAVDTVKVNKVVAEILNEIAAQDDFVDVLKIELDEVFTNVEKPSLGVSVEASTRQAAWSSETTNLVAELKVDSKPASEGEVTVLAELSARLETDVTNLAKYVVRKDVCDVFDFTPNQESKACKTLEKEITLAESFEEQVEAVSKAFDAFKLEIKAELETLNKELEKGEIDSEEKERLNYLISDLEEALEVFEAVEFNQTDSSIEVKADFDDFFGNDSDSYFTLEVREDFVTVSLVFNFLMDELDFKNYSSFPIEIIRVLESDTQESKEYVSGFAKFYIEILKDLVTED